MVKRGEGFCNKTFKEQTEKKKIYLKSNNVILAFFLVQRDKLPAASEKPEHVQDFIIAKDFRKYWQIYFWGRISCFLPWWIKYWHTQIHLFTLNMCWQKQSDFQSSIHSRCTHLGCPWLHRARFWHPVWHPWGLKKGNHKLSWTQDGRGMKMTPSFVCLQKKARCLLPAFR